MKFMIDTNEMEVSKDMIEMILENELAFPITVKEIAMVNYCSSTISIALKEAGYPQDPQCKRCWYMTYPSRRGPYLWRSGDGGLPITYQILCECPTKDEAREWLKQHPEVDIKID